MIKFIMNNKNDNNTDRGIEEKKGEHGSFNTFALILQAYFFIFHLISECLKHAY